MRSKETLIEAQYVQVGDKHVTFFDVVLEIVRVRHDKGIVYLDFDNTQHDPKTISSAIAKNSSLNCLENYLLPIVREWN